MQVVKWAEQCDEVKRSNQVIDSMHDIVLSVKWVLSFNSSVRFGSQRRTAVWSLETKRTAETILGWPLKKGNIEKRWHL